MISEYEILSVILQTMEKKTTYTFDEATQGALEYFGGDALAARVWASKYAMKDSYGNIYEQSPDDMHHRIAREIARQHDGDITCTSSESAGTTFTVTLPR